MANLILRSDKNVMPFHQDYLELLRFYGKDFRLDWCDATDEKGEAEAAKAIAEGREKTWPEETAIFTYQNIGLMTMGIHRPYISRILADTANQGPLRILEVGPGGGQLGLALHTLGYRMSFLELYGTSVKFLLWRLLERRLSLPVYLWADYDTIPKQDIAICFDVMEHLEPNERDGLLKWLGEIAGAVYVNVIIDDKHDSIHKRQTLEEVVAPLLGKWEGHIGAQGFYPNDDGEFRQYLVIYGDSVVA